MSFYLLRFSDEVAEYIGERFAHSLVSLELRACSNITDPGIIKMCEGLSGIKAKRAGVEPASEHHSILNVCNDRYKFFNRHETEALLKHLNLADLK